MRVENLAWKSASDIFHYAWFEHVFRFVWKNQYI